MKERTKIGVVAALALWATAGVSPGAFASAVDEVTAPPSAPRVESLLQSMTLAEKIGQLTQCSGGAVQDVNPVVTKNIRAKLAGLIRSGTVGSLLGAHGAAYTNGLQRVAVEESRWHIPLILGNDVIHGYRTIFPIPLAEASGWDPTLVECSARVAAVEAAAAGTHWTFAPMVDVSRDPRWGRVAEGSGEDPFLGAALAAARVRGFQGADLKAADSILACAKHFAAYGGAEGGRDYNTVDISRATLHNVYLPPFEAAVRAGVGTLMSAFNEINGVPATANRYLLTDVLRNRWGFEGFVVSDWDSIAELATHGFAADRGDAAALALHAGVDMDMASFVYRDTLADAVAKGRVSVATIDRAVRRVLRAKVALGFFEHPYVDPAVETRVTLSDAHRRIAREVAWRSIVLLRNEGSLLPLGHGVRSIAVIGPLATSRRDPLGTWAGIGRPEDVITVLDGIRERAGETGRVAYARGCGVNDAETSGLAEAVALARTSDVAILVVGESADMSGEAHSRSSLDLPGIQRRLVQAVWETGTPTVVVLMNGRPLSIAWTAEHVPAIVEAWHLGVECGHAVADVLFGDVNPSGKLPMTFPRTVGQVPIYYAHKNTGRPPDDGDRYTSKYIDLPSTPLYPFGFGLSYTTFAYGPLRLSTPRLAPGETLHVSARITNTGMRPGEEIVQLYVHQHVASLTPPVKRLCGFQRVALEPGASKSVTFELSEELGFFNGEGRRVVEPGKFTVWVGPNAAEGRSAAFELTAP